MKNGIFKLKSIFVGNIYFNKNSRNVILKRC